MTKPNSNLADHAPVFGVTPSGTRLSIIEGVLSAKNARQDTSELGTIIDRKEGLLYVRFSVDSVDLLSTTVLRVVAEMVDHLNEQVKS